VHTSPWLAVGTATPAADAGVITIAGTVISAIRKAKSEARQSMRAPVRTVRISGPAPHLESLRTVSGDITAAGNVGTLVLEPGGAQELLVDVQLADASSSAPDYPVGGGGAREGERQRPGNVRR